MARKGKHGKNIQENSMSLSSLDVGETTNKCSNPFLVERSNPFLFMRKWKTEVGNLNELIAKWTILGQVVMSK